MGLWDRLLRRNTGNSITIHSFIHSTEVSYGQCTSECWVRSSILGPFQKHMVFLFVQTPLCVGNIKLVQFETKNYLELKPKLNLEVKPFKVICQITTQHNNPYCFIHKKNHKACGRWSLQRVGPTYHLTFNVVLRCLTAILT